MVSTSKESKANWCITFIDGALTRNVEWMGKQDPYIIFKTQGRELKTRTHDEAGFEPKWD